MLFRETMQQLSLFQKAKDLPRRHVNVAAYSGESHSIQILTLALGLCVAAYLYFVGVSILNVITHKQASVETDRLRSVVGTLEQDYFELSQAVTPEMAGRVGLSSAKKAEYVRRPGGVASNLTTSGL